jgi:2-polyprenyl-6-methoxyphenol hydroxylase-like FAD-dependent oxidoreductase
MSRLRQRAIVIGAGIGGLSAAAALSFHFEEVIVLDRDTLPPSAASRAGTPQDRHPHGILAGGSQALDTLLPSFASALADAGAVPVNVFRDFRFERPDVGCLPRRDSGTTILFASRPLIEGVLRRQVGALANVTLRSGCRVTELVANGTRPSVHSMSGDGEFAAEVADLVVDAGGRGALTLALFDKLGWDRPAETSVGVDISYTTAVLSLPAMTTSRDWEVTITLPDPPHSTTGAVLMPMEGRRCFVTLAEHHAQARPNSWDAMLYELARLKTPTIYEVVRDLSPLEDLRYFVWDESRWRHFERLERLPHGVLPMADSLCRFNPVYGQGMSVAALQARLLRDVLGRVAGEIDPIGQLQAQFMSEVGAVLQTPWSMGVNADFAYAGTRGERPEQYEERRQWETALFRAVVADPVVQTAFSDVWQLIKPFELLQEPDIHRRIAQASAAAFEGADD